MKPLFIHYSKCSTCRKAAKWLKDNGIEIEMRDIIEHNPSKEELILWHTKYPITLSKIFNTSGVRYRELNLKSVVNSATDEELIETLSSEGKLIKRPVLVTDSTILFGFNEDKWREALL